MGVGYAAVSTLAFDLGQPKTVTAMYGQGYFLWGYRLSHHTLNATFIGTAAVGLEL